MSKISAVEITIIWQTVSLGTWLKSVNSQEEQRGLPEKGYKTKLSKGLGSELPTI